MSSRPFRILGIQQVAIGGSDKDLLRRLWVEMLGGEQTAHFESEFENVNEDVLQFGKPPFAQEVDLMEPLDPEGKPRVDAVPLNHVGLWVDDLKTAYDWLEAQGVRFTPGGIRKGATGHEICFIHPKPSESHPISGNGVLIELVQAPPDVIDALK